MDDTKIRNMEEFSAVSGISRPTVSKYFNDPASVRPSTRLRIEDALRRYDFRPNIFAVNQNRKLTKTIGILVPYLADPFFAEMVRMIERLCIAAGYWPIVFSAHGEVELENNALSTLESLRPAGALIAPLGRTSDVDAVRRFTEAVPTVVFDSHVPVGRAFVGSNNFQSIPLMVEYLCRSGEPPCFFEMPPVNPNANKRREAYRQAMERRGFDPMIFKVEARGWDFERIGFEEGGRLIAERAFPTNTILCSNDRLAIGLLSAAYQKGFRVGRGEGCALRIAGHDDHPWSRFSCPPLTTVAQDYRSIAETSVQTLFAVIDGASDGASDGAGGAAEGTGRNEVLFDGKLIMRASA